jgi:hypothetical protein
MNQNTYENWFDCVDVNGMYYSGIMSYPTRYYYVYPFDGTVTPTIGMLMSDFYSSQPSDEMGVCIGNINSMWAYFEEMFLQ